MPGLDGSELARRLKQTRGDLKVLLISGYTDGCNLREPFLPKPFAPAALLRKVRDLLDAPCEPSLQQAQIRGK